MQVGENTYHNTDEKHKAKYMATPQTARLARAPRAAAAQENMKSRTPPISADW